MDKIEIALFLSAALWCSHGALANDDDERHPNPTEPSSCQKSTEAKPVELSQKEREHRLNQLIRQPKYNPNARDEKGWTILHHAACYNDAGCIEILIESANADVTRVDNEGLLPLDIAILNNCKRAAFCLLRRGGLPRDNNPVENQITALTQDKEGWNSFVVELERVKEWTARYGKAPLALFTEKEIKQLNEKHGRN